MAKAKLKDSNYLKQVRDQYENYPYPMRNPENEKKEIAYAHSDSLSCMNHYGFSGKRDFSKGMRALVAGGGTGDSAILLAEQLRDTDSEIVYMDISTASMDIAKQRAKIRQLDNIRWIHASLLDIPKLKLGTFDYINCTGVLHHLTSPEAGLAALNSALKEDGLISIMIYAKYGRKDVYQMQELLRLINKDEPDMQRKVDKCKVILNNLKASWVEGLKERFIRDIKVYGDIGIYDLFLHSQDRAYTVQEAYAFVRSSGLEMVHLFGDILNGGNQRYKPESYIKDATWLKGLENSSQEERQAVAELLHGGIYKHSFYVARSPRPEPKPEMLDNIPSLAQLISDSFYKTLYESAKKAQVGQSLNCTIITKIPVSFLKTENTAYIFKYMDGQRTLREIFQKVRTHYQGEKKPTNDDLLKEFRSIYDAFIAYDCMFLRHRSVPGVKDIYTLQQNFKARLEVLKHC